MRFPSKLFHYKETVIYDCNIIMENLDDDMTILFFFILFWVFFFFFLNIFFFFFFFFVCLSTFLYDVKCF